jgi:hypothetical protein
VFTNSSILDHTEIAALGPRQVGRSLGETERPIAYLIIAHEIAALDHDIAARTAILIAHRRAALGVEAS